MRVLVVKKKRLFAAAIGVLVLAAVIIGVSSLSPVGTPTFNTSESEPINGIKTDDKIVALSFDTSFSEDKTREILQVLSDKGVAATFFVMGLWAQENPNLVRLISGEGHEVGSHSMIHEHYPKMTDEDIVADLAASKTTLKDLIGQEIMLFRAPYGHYTPEVVQSVRAAGMLPIKWSLDAQDWKDEDEQVVAKRVIDNVKPGDIIVMQNNTASAPGALSMIIDELTKNEYKIVTVGELLEQ